MTADEIPLFRPESKLLVGVYELFEDWDGFRFRLKASNGWIIAVSAEAYTNKADATRAIDAVRRAASRAKFEDLTESSN